MKPYYRVYRVDNGKPTIKHDTLEDAVHESERLAATRGRGDTFEILKCLGVTRTVNPHTFWMDGVIPPHNCDMHRALDGTCLVCGKIIDDDHE